MDHPPNSHQYPNHSIHLNRSHTPTTSSAELESRTYCFVASWRPLSTLPRWWSPRKISRCFCSKTTCCCSWWWFLRFSSLLSLPSHNVFENAKKCVKNCAYMLRLCVRRLCVLVSSCPSLFWGGVKGQRDRINFESVSKGENFLKKKKRKNFKKRATTKDFWVLQRYALSLLVSLYSVCFLLRVMIVLYYDFGLESTKRVLLLLLVLIVVLMY